MSPNYKFITLNDKLVGYIDAHRSDAGDPLLRELHMETQKMGDISRMQISGDQGALLSVTVAAMSAKTCVEIGTFTGYSSLCIARSLPDGGKLHCFDVSDEYTQTARKYWKKAGLDKKIELHLGPAQETLATHCPGEIDFAFIDADKGGYDFYYEFLLSRMRPNGLILFDNMLWSGAVVDAEKSDESTRAIRALNDKLTNDARIESVLIPVADGIHICRKKA